MGPAVSLHLYKCQQVFLGKTALQHVTTKLRHNYVGPQEFVMAQPISLDDVWCCKSGKQATIKNIIQCKPLAGSSSYCRGVFIHHSSLGNRGVFNCKEALTFYVWGNHRRVDLYTVWCLENVEAFGDEEVVSCIGDFYFIERVMFGSKLFGSGGC